MFRRPSQLPASLDLRSKQAAHCTVRSALSGTQRGERMLLNKMYSPLWESSDANWLASVGGSEKEGNRHRALRRVCASLVSPATHRSTLSTCVSVALSPPARLCVRASAAQSGGEKKRLAEASRAPRRKHIGQLRARLCVARLRVWLIESQRQPLTALRLGTLLVITHKSLFPCIGSLAQLRPHQQST